MAPFFFFFKVRMQQNIDDDFSRKRDASIMTIQWVTPFREWLQDNIARVFDGLRRADIAGDE